MAKLDVVDRMAFKVALGLPRSTPNESLYDLVGIPNLGNNRLVDTAKSYARLHLIRDPMDESQREIEAHLLRTGADDGWLRIHTDP